jgi:chromosome segregation ATPase
MSKGSAALLLFAGGVAAGVLLTCWGVNKQVEHLKRSGDEAQAAAAARDSAATAFKDSAFSVIDSLQNAKRPTIIRISVDSAKQDSLKRAMGGLKTAQDTIHNQAQQIIALEDQVDSLKVNARRDSLSLFGAMAAAQVLEDSLHAQTQTIRNLDAEIQRLNSHRLPAWARTGFAVLRSGLAIKGLVDVAHGK